METVTAVKIQIEYEKPLNRENPRTAMARKIKPRIKNGPVKSDWPINIKTIKTTKKRAETPSNVL